MKSNEFSDRITSKKPADFRSAAEVFKALANPNRLPIIDGLGQGERCVADLTDLVALDISTVSNHLSVLLTLIFDQPKP